MIKEIQKRRFVSILINEILKHREIMELNKTLSIILFSLVNKKFFHYIITITRMKKKGEI